MNFIFQEQPEDIDNNTGTDLPQTSEFSLFDAQELREFTGDNSGTSGGVVQNRLPKGCSSPQGANNNSILKHNKMAPWSTSLNNFILLHNTI